MKRIINRGMKRFKQYITEKPAKLSATLPYKGSKWEDFRGLENPNERELITFLKKSKSFELRFVVSKEGLMWVWDSNHGLHEAVIYAMTGERYSVHNLYAKGLIGFLDLEDEDARVHMKGNLKVWVMNERAVGPDFALKNKLLKALAKRINSAGKDKVYWSER